MTEFCRPAAVVVVADKLNESLSVTAPNQLSRLSVSATAAPADQPDARRVMFEGEKFAAEPIQSDTQLITTLVQSIRASFVMQSVRVVLYLGNTELVPYDIHHRLRIRISRILKTFLKF